MICAYCKSPRPSQHRACDGCGAREVVGHGYRPDPMWVTDWSQQQSIDTTMQQFIRHSRLHSGLNEFQFGSAYYSPTAMQNVYGRFF